MLVRTARPSAFPRIFLAATLLGSTVLAQETYIKASNTGSGDRFGSSVAISGDTLVVGADTESSAATGVNGDQSNNDALRSGAAYVFVRSGSTWVQQAYLKASNAETNDEFGYSVAISGDTIAVGARRESGGATGVNGDDSDNSSHQSGAVYVFVRSGTTWTQQAYVKASNTEPGDEFGVSVALSGDTLAVGAWHEDSNATGIDGSQGNGTGGGDSGAVYVFVRSGSTWSQQAYIKASNTGPLDTFGESLALSGDTLIVASQVESSPATGVNGFQGNDFAGQGSGAAYVFVRSGSTWSQEAYLKATNTEAGDQFGQSVDVYGDTAVVGAWVEAGGSTGVGGDENDNSASGAGAAYVYTRSGTTWTPQAYLKASNTEATDHFGYAVALGEDTVVVGASDEDSDAVGLDGDAASNLASGSGAAYLFVRSGSTWSPKAYFKATNSGNFDHFGEALALSGDTLIVGAKSEDSGAIGIGGDGSDNFSSSSGAAYAFSGIAPALSSTMETISLTTGGSQVLDLGGGAPRADWFYWMFGSVTGTSPGLDFGGGVVLPLNFDAYFNLTLTKPGLGAFGNFVGQLDASGQATATLTLPSGLDPGLAGVTLNHAYLAAAVLGFADFASNAVPVLLVP